MDHYSHEHLLDFSAGIFSAMGCNSTDAETASGVLLAADLNGIDSHGISRLSGYVALWEAGRINTLAKPLVIRERKSVFSLDGDSGLGLVIAPYAMKLAIERASEYGSGWVAVQNSNHFGIAGIHAMMALEKDMIGMAMTNATPFVPPSHSKEAMLGTNPLAYAFPADQHKSLVIDMATASVARGKLEIAKRENKQIPLGWVVDKEGKPSKDVDVLEKGGMLTPLGSLEELSSHKGYALGSLVDILSAVLSGANYGPWVPPFVPYLPLLPNLPGKGLGHFFGAMEVDGFIPLKEFKKRMDHWINTFKKAQRIDKTQAVFVPGEKEAELRLERINQGIPLNLKVADDLKKLSLKFGISF